ncbi:hypothetical protein [Azohydromonas australica]|uniref:hypothetical protein n=1 Tax=Azohydromonas australica TaxID=364039 RepID=UPI0012EC1CF8|nr:hypothetical protein [Azohydromonas australica]
MDQVKPDTPSSVAQATEPPLNKPATAAQWHELVAKAFDKVDRDALHKRKVFEKNEGTMDENGITEFYACFSKSTSACQVGLEGKKDAFRKIQFFSASVLDAFDMQAKYASGGPKPSMRSYVSLRDCKSPALVILPMFRSRAGWLFLNQLSIMSDGVVVFDRKLDDGSVNRDHDEIWGIQESVHLVLESAEVDALKKLPDASDVIIRLSGQKGYVTLDKEYSRIFAKQLRSLYVAYDSLNEASKSVGTVDDSSCP